MITPYVAVDRYANYTICNIYYDTPQFDLILRSIEKTDKPTYKEKLRITFDRRIRYRWEDISLLRDGGKPENGNLPIVCSRLHNTKEEF